MWRRANRCWPSNISKVARIDDEVTVKRLKKQGNTVELLPENSEFKPIVVDLREHNFSIEGLAVGVIRNGEWL